MTEILCDRELVLDLVDAYDDLVGELQVVYYSQDSDAIQAAEDRVAVLLKQLGIEE